MGYPARLLSTALALSASSIGAQASKTAPPTISDSAVIAREQSVWDALARHDSTAALAQIGADVPFTIGSGTKFSRATSTAIVRNVTTRCETSRNRLDSVAVAHPTPTLTIVTYRVDLERTCNGNRRAEIDHVETVWGVRDGRWVGVAQNFLPIK